LVKSSASAKRYETPASGRNVTPRRSRVPIDSETIDSPMADATSPSKAILLGNQFVAHHRVTFELSLLKQLGLVSA
jgi:hypothetical protein